MTNSVSGGSAASFPEDRVPFHLLALKKALCKLDHGLGIVGLAAEDVEIRGVGLIGEMGGDQGRLDELGHGESRHPFVLTEMHHLGFPIAFHLDEVT